MNTTEETGAVNTTQKTRMELAELCMDWAQLALAYAIELGKLFDKLGELRKLIYELQGSIDELPDNIAEPDKLGELWKSIHKLHASIYELQDNIAELFETTREPLKKAGREIVEVDAMLKAADKKMTEKPRVASG